MFRNNFSCQYKRAFHREWEQNKHISRLWTLKKCWASSSMFYLFLYYQKYKSKERYQDGKHMEVTAYIKSQLIRSFSSPHFSVFRLNTEIYGVDLKFPYSVRRGKMQDRKTPHPDTFRAVSAMIHYLKK